MTLNAYIPPGPIQDKWNNAKFSYKLVNPANRRKFEILVVGSGLAGASAAASLAEPSAIRWTSRSSSSRNRLRVQAWT